MVEAVVVAVTAVVAKEAVQAAGAWAEVGGGRMYSFCTCIDRSWPGDCFRTRTGTSQRCYLLDSCLSTTVVVVVETHRVVAGEEYPRADWAA